MKRKYKADGWLGAMIATKLFIDFEKYEHTESYDRILKELGTRGKAEKGNNQCFFLLYVYYNYFDCSVLYIYEIFLSAMLNCKTSI